MKTNLNTMKLRPLIIQYNESLHTPYLKNGYHFSNLLFAFKVALFASFKVKYSFEFEVYYNGGYFGIRCL